MAELVTLLQLRTRARRRAHMVNDQLLTNADWNDLANQYVSDLWDLMATEDPNFISGDTPTQTTVPGTITYSLPSDFRSLVGVYGIDGTRKFEIQPLLTGRMGMYDVPDGVYTYFLRYVPIPPVFENDDSQLDSVSGWSKLVVCWMAREALLVEESDVSSLDAEIGVLKERIQMGIARRKHRGPKFIRDVETGSDNIWNIRGRIAGYELRGGKLDLYSGAWIGNIS